MKRDEEINLAISKYKQIERLHDEVHCILTPIADEAVANGREAVEDLISKLPSSFYRAELRVWLKENP